MRYFQLKLTNISSCKIKHADYTRSMNWNTCPIQTKNIKYLIFSVYINVLAFWYIINCSQQLKWTPSTLNSEGCHWLNGLSERKKKVNFSPPLSRAAVSFNFFFGGFLDFLLPPVAILNCKYWPEREGMLLIDLILHNYLQFSHTLNEKLDGCGKYPRGNGWLNCYCVTWWCHSFTDTIYSSWTWYCCQW